jgi:hypothetical protein
VKPGGSPMLCGGFEFSCVIRFSGVQFLLRRLAIDQYIGRFTFEASKGLLDGAELKRRVGWLAEPGHVNRNNHFGMAVR